MSPEKTKELISIYPQLFSDLIDKSPFFLFYFECRDGWFDLLKRTIEKLKVAIENASLPIEPKVFQVKEKHGVLRFYLTVYNGFIQKIIDEAESDSEEICEECGRKGREVKIRECCIHTLCDICEKDYSQKVLEMWRSYGR